MATECRNGDTRILLWYIVVIAHFVIINPSVCLIYKLNLIAGRYEYRKLHSFYGSCWKSAVTKFLLLMSRVSFFSACLQDLSLLLVLSTFIMVFVEAKRGEKERTGKERRGEN